MKRAIVASILFAVAPVAAPAAVIVTASQVAEPPAGGSAGNKAEGVTAAAKAAKRDDKPSIPNEAGWAGTLIALAGLGYAVRRRPSELLPQSI